MLPQVQGAFEHLTPKVIQSTPYVSYGYQLLTVLQSRVCQPHARRLFFRENFTALLLRQLALANLARVVELLCRGRQITNILPINSAFQLMASPLAYR